MTAAQPLKRGSKMHVVGEREALLLTLFLRPADQKSDGSAADAPTLTLYGHCHVCKGVRHFQHAARHVLRFPSRPRSWRGDELGMETCEPSGDRWVRKVLDVILHSKDH